MEVRNPIAYSLHICERCPSVVDEESSLVDSVRMLGDIAVPVILNLPEHIGWDDQNGNDHADEGRRRLPRIINVNIFRTIYCLT